MFQDLVQSRPDPAPLDILRALFCADGPGGEELRRLGPSAVRDLCEACEVLDAGSMLYSSLRRAGLLELVPADVRRRLQLAHATTTAHNLELLHEWHRLARAFEEAHIDRVPLKGVALFVAEVLRDPGARPTSDIDVLTRGRDRAAVTSVLVGQRYRQLAGAVAKHLPGFVRGNMLVEVHEHAFWTLPAGAPVEIDAMRDTSAGARLEQTVAHLLHHLFESSVTTPALIVKTLWDLNEVRVHVRARPEIARDVLDAARGAGLEHRLAAVAGLLTLATDAAELSTWTVARADPDVALLLEACSPSADARALRLRHRLRGFLRQPLWVTASFLRSRLLPGRRAVEAEYALPPGSMRVWPRYVGRTLRLAYMAAGDALHVLRPAPARRRP